MSSRSPWRSPSVAATSESSAGPSGRSDAAECLADDRARPAACHTPSARCRPWIHSPRPRVVPRQVTGLLPLAIHKPVHEGDTADGRRRRAIPSPSRPADGRAVGSRPTTSRPRSRCSAPCCCPARRSPPRPTSSLDAADFYRPAHGHVFEASSASTAPASRSTPSPSPTSCAAPTCSTWSAARRRSSASQARTPATSSAPHYARIVGEHAPAAPAHRRRRRDRRDRLQPARRRHRGRRPRRVDGVRRRPAPRHRHDPPIKDLLDASLTPARGALRAGRVDHRPRHRLRRPRRAAVGPAAVHAEHRRRPPAMGKCVTADTLLVDPATGELVTLGELPPRHRRATSRSSTLDDDHQLTLRRPSAVIDDGMKPVFRVRPRTGREIRTTAAHPFLTCDRVAAAGRPHHRHPRRGAARAADLRRRAGVGRRSRVLAATARRRGLRRPRRAARRPFRRSRRPARRPRVLLVARARPAHRRRRPARDHLPHAVAGGGRRRAAPAAALRHQRPAPRTAGRGGSRSRSGTRDELRARFERVIGLPRPQPACTPSVVRRACSHRARPAVRSTPSRSRRATRCGGRSARATPSTVGPRPRLGPARPRCTTTRASPSDAVGHLVGRGRRHRARRAWSRSTTSPSPASTTSSPPTCSCTTPRSASAWPRTSPCASSKPVLFFSLEMGHHELTQRVLAAEARVDSKKLRTGRLTEPEWRRSATPSAGSPRRRSTSTTTRTPRSWRSGPRPAG